MRVLIISHEFDLVNHYGGMGVAHADLARALVETGHDVTVITKQNGRCKKNGPFKKHILKNSKNKIHIIFATGLNNSFFEICYSILHRTIVRKIVKKLCPELWQILKWNLFAFWTFHRIYKKCRVDIIHTGDYYMGGLFIKLIYKLPLVVQLHGWSTLVRRPNALPLTFEFRCIDLLERLYAAGADGIFANSRSVAMKAKKWMDIKRAIPTLYFPLFFLPTPGTKSTIRNNTIVNIGRYEKRKGVDVLFKVFIAIAAQHPHIELQYIGQDTRTFYIKNRTAPVFFREYVRSFPIASDIKLRIHFMTQKSRTGWMRLAKNSLIGVFPARYEPLGIAVAEYMSLGKAAIVSKQGGMKEFVRHGYNGFLIQPSFRNLKKMLEYALDHPQLVTKLSDAASLSVRNHFEATKNITKIANLYSKLLEENFNLL